MDIIQRFETLKGASERSNFKTIWQTAAEYCSPHNDNINQISTPGIRKPLKRFVDVGIRSNRVFTSGMSSNLIPAGSRFFEYSTADRSLRRNDAVGRYWSDVTSITYDILNSSNFFQEVTKCISHLGYIGTCCILAEPANPIRFKAHSIEQYYIAEDAYGMVDTVYFELKLTNRQAFQLFGDDLSEKVRDAAANPKTMDQECVVIHAIEPRMDFKTGATSGKKRPIKSCYVEYATKHLIKEDGYYEMPYAIGRFYQTTDEVYGRSPALEVSATLSLVNAMERTRINAAERVSNPPWLSPNDGSVRAISNQPDSVIYWDASNPQSKPEQLSVKDNVSVNDAMIQIKNEEIEDAFFLPLFNPLVNRRNMTATESSQRIDIALQNLVPAIGRMTSEFMSPLFKRIYHVLARQGVYPDLPKELRGSPKVGFTSKATMAIEQLELAGVYQTMERVAFLGQMQVEGGKRSSVLDNFNMDEIARMTAEANAVPTDILRSEYDVENEREAMAKEASAMQERTDLETAGNVYNNTSKAPEAGSGASMLLEEAGLA